jgi:nicotinamide mononucleotide transporter
MSLLEIIGTILGVIGVTLMIRQNIWTWPVGLVQVSVSAWLFYGAKLYSDTILQGFFFVIQTYGWWHWVQGGRARRAELPVTTLSIRTRAGWLIAGLLGTWLWGEFMRRNTDAALPHWDASILVFSLIAQWLQARKRLENWIVWMAVNVIAVGVFWAKDLRAYAGLYAAFFCLAVAGHLAWQRSRAAGGRG